MRRRRPARSKLDPLFVTLPWMIRSTKIPCVSLTFRLADFDELLDLGHAALPQVAIIGLKFREVFRKMRLPDLSPFHAFTSETSALMPGSSTYSVPSKTFVLLTIGQFGAEAGAGVKAGDARAARAQPFGECALRR